MYHLKSVMHKIDDVVLARHVSVATMSHRLVLL